MKTARYVLHVQDINSERVVEWTGTAPNDVQARNKAQSAAFSCFGNSGKVIRLRKELDHVPTSLPLSETRIGNKTVYRPDTHVASPPVPAIMQSKAEKEDAPVSKGVIREAVSSLLGSKKTPSEKSEDTPKVVWEGTVPPATTSFL